jgi:AraC family transcriptional regulator
MAGTKSLDILNDLSEHVFIKINSCNSIIHEKGWVEVKSHFDYDIWYILSGKLCIEVGAKKYTANEGDIVFFYPYMPYMAYNNTHSCKFVYVHFDFRLGNNANILNDFNLAGIIPSREDLKETSLFSEACMEFEKKSAMSSIYLKGSFIILLASIFDYYRISDNEYNSFKLDNTYNNAGSKVRLETLQPVFQYVSNHINKQIKISSLADSVNMSEKYFISYFKSVLGITPGNYITQLKMNRAREYLYQRKFSVKEISEFLGYSDQYTFSKAFKKYFNVPPSKFL